MRKITFKSVVWKEGKHFVAQCLNVDVSSFGASKKEALANLDEALTLYFDDKKSPKVTKIDKAEVIVFSLSHA